MTGERYRLVTTTVRGRNHEAFTSTDVLTEAEAARHLAVEMLIHAAEKWVVRIRPDGTVVCEQPGIRREIRAMRFDPMDDVNPAGKMD